MERENSICWLIPQMASMARAGLFQSQEPGASDGSVMCVQTPQELRHPLPLTQKQEQVRPKPQPTCDAGTTAEAWCTMHHLSAPELVFNSDNSKKENCKVCFS